MNSIQRFVRVSFAVAMIATAACDSTDPVVATTIDVSQSSVALDAIGATATITATVNDQNGAPMQGVPVAWSSTGASITLNATGASVVVTAVATGGAVVTATAKGVSTVVPVNVAQVAAAPQKLAGDAQAAGVGAELPQPLQVRVQDRLGNKIAGQTVTFTVSSGGGTVTPVSAVSDANGVASTRWTIGTNTAVQNVVSVSVGGGAAVTFSANANAGPPVAITVNAGNNQAATVGTAVTTPPSVRVADSFNNPVPSTVVIFAVAGGGGSVTGLTATSGANGVATVGSWTLGTIAGSNTITATVGSLAPVTFAANALTGPAASLTVFAGNNQSALPGTAVPVRPAVRVADQFSNPVAGASVTFQVTTGGGSVTGPTVTTDANGVAAPGGWTVGTSLGTNTLTAAVAGATFAGNSAVFTAFAAPSSQFAITLRFLTTLTTSQTAAFTNAASRWASIILNDLPDLLVTIPGALCGPNAPNLQAETVDDMLIFATIEAIDGPGGILGSAGPCFVRTGTTFTVVGQMRFDVADVANLEASGAFESVVLHEMGHVIGIGTAWATRGLVTNPTTVVNQPRDSFFNGSNGIDGFNSIGGTAYTGPKVPVENTGGAGTINSHWRESVLGSELMTGFLNAGANPLSALTIRSLQDIGFTVNTLAAESFSLAASLRAGPQPSVVDLGNDLFDGPLYSIDSQGRVRRIR